MVIVNKKGLTWKIGHESPSTLEHQSTFDKTPITPLTATPTPTNKPQISNLRRFDVCNLLVDENYPSNKQNEPQSPNVHQHRNRRENHKHTSNKTINSANYSLSRLPGLNPDSEAIEKHQIKIFRNIRQSSDAYGKLCRSGGRMSDLLSHQECKMTKHRPSQLYLECNVNRDMEIPIIDQIRLKRDNHIKLRPDILPVEVESKAKLYFAFNRTKGTITRVIATQPRSFRFGLK